MDPGYSTRPHPHSADRGLSEQQQAAVATPLPTPHPSLTTCTSSESHSPHCAPCPACVLSLRMCRAGSQAETEPQPEARPRHHRQINHLPGKSSTSWHPTQRGKRKETAYHRHQPGPPQQPKTSPPAMVALHPCQDLPQSSGSGAYVFSVPEVISSVTSTMHRLPLALDSQKS